jgi:hypothetical protein
LLPFSPEPLVLSSAVWKFKNNFASGSVLVSNLVSDIKGGTKAQGVSEKGAEENIWIKAG